MAFFFIALYASIAQAIWSRYDRYVRFAGDLSHNVGFDRFLEADVYTLGFKFMVSFG